MSQRVSESVSQAASQYSHLEVHAACVGREQRWVHVERTLVPALAEVGGEDAHEANEEDSVAIGSLEAPSELSVVPACAYAHVANCARARARACADAAE